MISSFTFFGCWEWNIIGPGTLFAMFFVGYVIKLINPHLGWFDRLIAYRPAFADIYSAWQDISTGRRMSIDIRLVSGMIFSGNNPLKPL